MEASTEDDSLFYDRASHWLVGLSGFYVDEILQAGTYEFNSPSQSSTRERFNNEEPEKVAYEFADLFVSAKTLTPCISRTI